MGKKHLQFSRREFLTGTGMLAAALGLNPMLRSRLMAAPMSQDVPSVEPISILINDSPWFPGFEALVNLYTETTGNQVNLNVTPFNGMTERTRNAVSSSESEFDIVNLNELAYAEFYQGGVITPINEIDPDFELDPNIIEYNAATRWDFDLGTSTPDGTLLGLPINGNIQLHYWRTDLFEEAGFEAPQTWDELETIAQELMDRPQMNGFAVRANPVWWEYQAYMQSFGAPLVDQNIETGEWSIGYETEAGVRAAETWHRLGTSYGPPNYTDLGQAELLALMAGGRMAQVHMVGAAAPNFKDPNQSVVTDTIAAGVVPGETPESRSTMSGIWVMGIPVNLPDARKQAGLTFLKWALSKDSQLAYTLAGAIPVRQDVYEELSDHPDVGWWASAFAESTPFIKAAIRIPEAAQIREINTQRMVQTLTGELSVSEATEMAAEEIRALMEEAGYAMATS